MKELILLDNAIVFDGADTATDTASNTNTAAGTEVPVSENESTAAAGNVGSFGTFGLIIYIVGLIAVFFFFVIRPQKKRETELKNLQSSVKVGDSVVTSSGFYGRVTDIYSDSYVIEFGLNKGVRVPVSKAEIVGIKEPNLSVKSSEE